MTDQLTEVRALCAAVYQIIGSHYFDAWREDTRWLLVMDLLGKACNGERLECDPIEVLLPWAAQPTPPPSAASAAGPIRLPWHAPERIELWAEINEYAESCGGDTSEKTARGSRRIAAVSRVERALEACCGTLEDKLKLAEKQIAEYAERAEADCARLREERDEARAECAELREDLKQRNKSGAKCCAEERRALQVRITALTEALRPFAEQDAPELQMRRDAFPVFVPLGLVRAARAALAGEVGK